jgi:hypothetical protein
MKPRLAHPTCIFALFAGLWWELPARGDALDNWTQSLVTNVSILSGAAYGNGRYVVVGQAGGDWGVIETSSDGWHWTQYTDNSLLELYDVAYANGVFVAVGWDYYLYTGNIYHSTNGTDWVHHSTDIANVNRVVYGSGLFVAVGDNTRRMDLGGTTNWNIYTSPDGINWTPQKSVLKVSDSQIIYDVAYGAGYFVAVDGTHHIYTSATGTSWSRVSNSLAGRQVSFCNTFFLIPAGPGTNLISTDAATWSAVTNSTGATFGRVAFGDGCYVALAYPWVFSSTDGTNWISRSAPLPQYSTTIVYQNLRFLALTGNYNSYSPSSTVNFSDPLVDLRMTSAFPLTLKVSGVSNRNYRIDQRTDLQRATWQPATNFTLGNSPTLWTNTQSTNARQYYRAALLP